MILYELNRKANITIMTPCGESEAFSVERIVKQGTIFGPQLCCSSTAKVDQIGERKCETYISTDLHIGTLIFVDDIEAIGTRKTMIVAAENLQHMERKKGFRFNTDKTKYVIVKTGKEKGEEVDIEVAMGKIERVEKYKYLGNWIGENGRPTSQIEAKEKEVTRIVIEVSKLCSEQNFGKMSTATRLILYEKTVVPGIIFNLECWTELGDKEMERLEKIQGQIIKGLLQLPESTPYWGLIKETGVWPIRMKIIYQRLMLFQNMISSDEERLGKKIVEDQLKNQKKGWVSETKRLARTIGIDVDRARSMKKSKWKKELKINIERKINEDLDKVEVMYRKMRHQKGQKFGRKSYLEEMTIAEASLTMRRRLEMIDVGNNMGKNRICKECNVKETTEHMITCRNKNWKIEEQIQTEWLKETNNLYLIRKVNKWLEREIDTAEEK